MQLWIKTPLYKNTNYCPHLVEHCVLSGYKSEQVFFDFVCPFSTVETGMWKTKFRIWGNDSIKRLVQGIQKPLDYKVITSEKKLLKQELSDEKGIGDILNDKIGKILYEKEWLSASQSIQCTQQEVIAYHQKRYTEDNMRIVDNDRNNIILKRPSLQVLIFPKFKDKTYYFTAKGDKYIAFIKDYSTIENYTLLYFLEWLYDLISSYEYRYLGISYFYPISHFLQYPDRIAFVRGIGYNVEASFLQRAKQMFIELDHKVNEICLMYEIIAGQIISSDQVKNIIQNITKKQIDYYIL